MAHYAIGDIQGCYEPLQRLLAAIQFNPIQDQLWLTGDLLNRGADSLKVLRFLKNLPQPVITVLGNHDLHFLAVAYGCAPSQPKDTFQDILQAPDKLELCAWLRQQPLLHYDPVLNYAIAHAGILPQWSLAEAEQYAREVEQQLQGNNFSKLLANLYGNEPQRWDAQLTDPDRYRFIINAFTRMRFCTLDSALELLTKTPPEQNPAGCIPWYAHPHRKTKNINIVFGHWAALNGKVHQPHLFALDTGCVWGHCLTAMRLEDQQIFKVNCER